MSQIAQLSEAEIEARFHVTGQRPVAFLLAGYARDADQFSVAFGGELFLSTLLDASQERNALIFDCSGSAEINRRLLGSDRLVFVGRPGGIHVQFSTGAAREVLHGGSKAFVVALPKFVVRLQRRESFRIETPRVRPLEFFGRLPAGGLLKLPAHDISVAGLGLMSGEPADGLVPGLALRGCRVTLPDDNKDLFFDALVSHLTGCDGRFGNRQWRIGVRFDNLSAGYAARLQRYIDRLQRERRELA